MPRIPTTTAENQYLGEFISPERATVQERAGVRAGERIADLGGFLLDREVKAVRVERSLRIENQMNEDTLALAETFHGRTDYENFMGDAETALTDMGQKYGEMASDDRFLGIAVSQAFNQKRAQVMLMVQQKTRQTMVERANGEHQVAGRLALEEYSNALTPQHRDEIVAGYSVKTMELVAAGIINKDQAGMDIENFIHDAEILRAKKMTFEDPTLAVELLPTDEFNLAPDDRQLLTEQATRAAGIQRKEVKGRTERLRKEAHDEEVDEIARLWLTKDYTGAYARLVQSKTLSGEEIRTWGKAIATSAKPLKEDDFDADYLSQLKVRIHTDPHKVDKPEDIYKHVGLGKDKQGLTADQAIALDAALDKEVTEDNKPRTTRLKTATDIVERLRTKKAFTSPDEPDDVENELEARKAIDAVMDWQKENPDDDPVKWVEENIKAPAEESWLRRLMQAITHERPAEVEPKKKDKRAQAEEILRANGKVVNEETIKQVEDQL